MELLRLARRPPDWDQQIRRFPNKTLGHESAWLDHVSSVSPRTTIEYFEIRDGSHVVGYFCMARVQKFLYSLGERRTNAPPLATVYMVDPAGEDR